MYKWLHLYNKCMNILLQVELRWLITLVSKNIIYITQKKFNHYAFYTLYQILMYLFWYKSIFIIGKTISYFTSALHLWIIETILHLSWAGLFILIFSSAYVQNFHRICTEFSPKSDWSLRNPKLGESLLLKKPAKII